MEILNLDSVMMPKYCELEEVRKQAIRFLDYWRRAKQREPERLMIDVKYHGLWLRAIKSNEDLSRRFGTNPEFRLLDLPVEFVLNAQELIDYCCPETDLEKALYNALEKELDRMAWLIRELEDDDVDAEAYLMNFS